MDGDLKVTAFASEVFLPARLWEKLTEIRRDDPERPRRSANERAPRERPWRTERLNILAADHPARRVTTVRGDALAIANRRDQLARVARVLQSETCDGVMATMDVLEDLLVLDDLLRSAGEPPLLDGKLLIVSLNRGGLAGTSWEMDDPVTGPPPEVCSNWGFDGTKLLLRICDEEPDSLKTMLACADAITRTNALGLPTFLEPLPVVKTDAGYKVVKTAVALAKIVGVAAALGDSSRYLWLKLPYCEHYELVARATSLPILLLGGEAGGDARGFLGELAQGLAAGPNVRGALAGRNVLYPVDEDPLVMAAAAGAIIHRGLPAGEAWTAAEAERGRGLDRLSRVAL